MRWRPQLVVLCLVATFVCIEPAPALAASRFEFHNRFWLNLHHFLYVQARARMKTPDSARRAVAGVRADLEMIDKLPAADQRAWEAALAYYQRDLATLDIVFDDHLRTITNQLAALDDKEAPAAWFDQALVEALTGAAAVYRAHWWPAHQKSNREFVSNLSALLQKYETTIADRIAAAYRIKWPVTPPYRVDVCAYTNWAGAYTTVDPPRLTMSSLDEGGRGTQALETVFHEALHALEGPFVEALSREAKAQNKRWGRQFTHAFIFYTAGAIVQLAVSGHTTYAEVSGIWERGPGEYRKLLDTYWRPYLEGKTTFDEAVKGIIGAL